MATAFARPQPRRNTSRPVDLERALPVKETAEAAFLGSILIDPTYALAQMRAATPNLAPGHFYSHTAGALHRLILTGILELEEAGQAIDPVTMADWLAEHGVEDPYGVVTTLTNAVVTSINAGSYARVVYANARQRAQIQTAYKLFQAAWAGDEESYARLTEKTERLREDYLPAKQRPLKVRSMREIMQTEYPEVRMLVEKVIQQGVVTLLAGKAKAGKSYLLLSAAYAVAEACQKAFASPDYHGLHCVQSHVLYMALEDTERRLKQRSKKMRGDLPVPECIDVCTEAPRIDAGVIAQLERYLDEHLECKLVIIDTLTSILPPPGKHGGGYLEDRLNMEGLRDLAHRRDVAILPVIHCRKADGSDVFDTIQTTMGTQGGAENLVVLQRRRGEDQAVLHVTGNDIESESLAMKWDQESCSWSILGDADEVAENKNEEHIFAAIEAVEREGKEGRLAAIAAQLKGEMTFSNVRTVLYRMAAAGKLTNTGGVFKNCAVAKFAKFANEAKAAKSENPPAFEEDFSDSHNCKIRNFANFANDAVTAEEAAEEQKDSAFVGEEIPFEQLLAEVRALWVAAHWRLIMIAGALRGGSEWMADKCLEAVAQRQDWAWLLEARQALQEAV